MKLLLAVNTIDIRYGYVRGSQEHTYSTE